MSTLLTLYVAFGQTIQGVTKDRSTDNIPSTTEIVVVGAPQMVDLGLSVKWATCNVGATSSEDYGLYFSWYDAIELAFGDGWRLPTQQEVQELVDNCSSTPTTLQGVNGCYIASRKEGFEDRSIFIPVAGRLDTNQDILVGYAGFCWSSTPDPDTNGRSYSLVINMDKSFSCSRTVKSLRQTIRLVK